MVLYFSATGNSAYVARCIGRDTGDAVVDLFQRIRAGDNAPIHSHRPWVVVTPTYAWRIPRIVEQWLRATPLEGSRDIYFVLTCGQNIGAAGQHLERFCTAKGLTCRGCAQVVMPENYIAMFQTPGPEEAGEIIRRAGADIRRAADCIRDGRPLTAPAPGLMGRLESGMVNRLFYPVCVSARRFRSTDACVSCGLCRQVCPMGNVTLSGGRPVWGDSCTHCMACICRCPAQAIEYGGVSRGKPRYQFPRGFEE